jgi:MFS family permease
MTEPISVKRLQAFTGPFTYQNFRYFWIATMLGSAGRWMEAVIFSWMTLQMTGSPFLVGVVSACRWAGYGLGPIFGAFADRYDRRALLLIITSSSVLYSFALAFLTTMDLVQYWHIIVIALAAGLTHAFDISLRYSFAGDLVDKRILTNAVALITVAIDITAVLGPAIAGPLLDIIGVGGVSWVLTVNYMLNIVALYTIRGTTTTKKAAEGSLTGNLKGGIHYILNNPPILALLCIAVVLNLLQFPLRYALMPVFANDILRVGASGYGFLLAASGAGALMGATVVAYIGDFRHKAWLCIVASALAGFVACAFSWSPWYLLSLGLQGCVGASEAICMITIAALLLLLTPTEMRGRVMGIRSLAILPLSLGNLISGAMASNFGAPIAGTLNAILLMLSILMISTMIPSLRRSG